MKLQASDPVPTLSGVRIAQLIECDGPGGAERVVAHLTTSLLARGAELVAFLPRGRDGWLGKQLRNSDIAIESFDRREAFHPSFWQWLTKTIHLHRIDVAHTHEFTFAVHGAWSAWRLGIGHVATIHGGRYWAGAWRRRAMFRLAVELGGELTTVSELLKDQLEDDLRLSPGRIHLVPNGVPCGNQQGRGDAVRRELGLRLTDKLAVAIGSLYPVKGHRTLVTALGHLCAKRPELHVAIAGQGNESDALRSQANLLGIGNRVHILGLRTDIPELLAASDVFVMPSLNEGLPMALLEALCAGKPIIASAVGGIPAALLHGASGTLVPPGNSEALAAALNTFLEDPDTAERCANIGLHHAREQFSVERMVDRYSALYARQLR